MIKVTAYTNPESIARRTQLSFPRKYEDNAGNANGGGLLHHPDRHTALQ